MYQFSRDVTGLNFTGFLPDFKVPDSGTGFPILQSTYAIVSFFCFFFSRPFMKISNFSKTVHTIRTKFSTVIFSRRILVENVPDYYSG